MSAMEQEAKEQRPKGKAGRTLLISNEHKDELSFDGLINTHTTNSGSRFIVFDNVDNSRSAYETLQEAGVKCKYSLYKAFFRLKDINLEDYDQVKNAVKELTMSCSDNVDVLYIKLYTKNKQLMGSGDLTVDTKEGLDALVFQKEGIKCENGSATFYRFKVKSRDDRPPPLVAMA